MCFVQCSTWMKRQGWECRAIGSARLPNFRTPSLYPYSKPFGMLITNLALTVLASHPFYSSLASTTLITWSALYYSITAGIIIDVTVALHRRGSIVPPSNLCFVQYHIYRFNNATRTIAECELSIWAAIAGVQSGLFVPPLDTAIWRFWVLYNVGDAHRRKCCM